MNNIVSNSNTIKDLVKNISDASEAQAEAIVQVNTGVDQISAVVSANTSMAVGSASASEELSSQSLILKNMIARFKLSENGEKGKTEHQAARFTYIDDEPESDATPEDSQQDVTVPDEDNVEDFSTSDKY